MQLRHEGDQTRATLVAHRHILGGRLDLGDQMAAPLGASFGRTQVASAVDLLDPQTGELEVESDRAPQVGADAGHLATRAQHDDVLLLVTHAVQGTTQVAGQHAGVTSVVNDEGVTDEGVLLEIGDQALHVLRRVRADDAARGAVEAVLLPQGDVHDRPLPDSVEHLPERGNVAGDGDEDPRSRAHRHIRNEGAGPV